LFARRVTEAIAPRKQATRRRFGAAGALAAEPRIRDYFSSKEFEQEPRKGKDGPGEIRSGRGVKNGDI